jgi:hypothetical protein
LTIIHWDLTVDAMPKAKTTLLRINPTLLRKVTARAKVENRTPTEYVEAAVREKLKRSPVTVIVHPKLRETIRKARLKHHTALTPAERRQARKDFDWMLDQAGIPR